jgi:hypothetical protein
MKKEWLVKTLAFGVVALFIGVTATPTIGVSSNFDDIIPPVTTISFNPTEPDGENGWYISNVTVTLNATDDDSGVNITKYRIDGSIWYNYSEPFILVEDGKDILIEFYSIDNTGNQEEIKSVVIDIDQTKPEITIDFWDYIGNCEFVFWAYAYDDTSRMNRVEFYKDKVLQSIDYGSGPTYCCVMKIIFFWRVFGLILNLNISEDFVKFFSIIVYIGWYEQQPDIRFYAYDNAGNWDFDMIYYPYDYYPPETGIYLFQNFTFTNNYKGFIGKHFVNARFYD